MKPQNIAMKTREREALQDYLANEAAYRQLRSASDLEALIRHAAFEKRMILQTDPAPAFEERLVALFAE